MNVIFDTNAVYYLDSELTPTDFKKLVEKVQKGLLKVHITPITVIEMTSRLKENPSDFKKVQKAIQKLYELKPIFLPNPEQQLGEYILDFKIDKKYFNQWNEVFYSIKIAKNLNELETGFDDLVSHTRRSVNITHIFNFRKEYEALYISDMQIPLKAIIPNFDLKVSVKKNTRLDKTKIVEFEKYLKSKNWSNLIKLMLLERTLLPLPTEQKDIDIIFGKIKYFKNAYENLLRKIFTEGLLPNLKRKNDYNDWHFMVYFNDDNDFVFITSENNALFKGLKDDSRLMSIHDLVKI